ncbi:uncharacterized protein FA14DRAFT_187471 [Meira miltonrushii]|uniref:Uncharacterized protein n=1 Tax=Meira miltonrushii TaxID=1280837 RepID=A0A316VMN2_9BASI|nr:uncharacterized protein FA14DRAFT_187471 [Meira miltonrushii]PWN37361.1 hypothetical protein FA14DRAFT_187471 [Meira miltonrushii]
MAAPTAIPHHETSSHHQGKSVTEESNVPLSRSPTGTSPRSMVSPIYTQAGRSAFSMPGPNSSSTSPTTTTWYSAGFASGNSQRVRSPTGPLNGTAANGSSQTGQGPVSSQVAPQRDQFPDARHPSHFRAASFGSASNASSLSSADLRDEPTTPKVENVTSMPLGRASSIPLGSSYERMKSRRDSWSFATAAGNRWSGLQSLRERTSTVGSAGVTMPTYNNDNSIPASAPPAQDTAGAGPMGGLLRKFSIGGGQPIKSPPTISTPATTGKTEATVAPVSSNSNTSPSRENDYFKTVPQTRGRQNSASSPNQRRRPSPMGERLLMGHFNAH